VLFRDAYNSGERRYVTGVGTRHRDQDYDDIVAPALDRGLNRSGVDRIDRMFTYLMEEASEARDNEYMDIDIVGFSRGAAQARDFANQIVAATRNGAFTYDRTVSLRPVRDSRSPTGFRTPTVRFRGTQCVRFRFLGLWDTVISVNSGRNYNMGIPSEFQSVAHAVALNEYRSQPNGTANIVANGSFWSGTRQNLAASNHYGGFPLVSIGSSSTQRGAVRTEMGFIGAHADIGGGYSVRDNTLPLVSLHWMVAQATRAGVQMNMPPALPTTNPVIHDQSNAIRMGNPNLTPSQQIEVPGTPESPASSTITRTLVAEDRTVEGAPGGNRQRTMTFNNSSMVNADTHRYISYTNRDAFRSLGVRDEPEALRGNSTGRVDIVGYMAWLRRNGYCFAGEECSRRQ
jgi:hypothetical protein